MLSSPVKKKNKERDDRLKIRTEKAGHICRNDDQLHNTESNLQCISNPASGPICSSNNLASTLPLDPANIFIPTSEAQLDNATAGKHTSDKGIQVNTTLDSITDILSKLTLLDLMTTEESFYSCTNLTFEQFNVLCTCVEKLMVQLEMEKSCVMDVNNMMLLTLTKLKLNISNICLAGMFKISRPTVKKYFVTMIMLLHICLKPFIHFTDQKTNMMNLPNHFKPFPETRVVIDCTEFSVATPSCLKCRNMLYSNYKSKHTLKLLLGVSPCGVITFVSKLYGGRASDKEMFIQSGLINKCEVGDAIMADRGFLIDEVCSKAGVKLIRPPFRNGKRRFTSEEATSTVTIARARVHIERVNQRIKAYKFLSHIEIEFLNVIDEIVFVICGLVNLSSPILGPDSF